MKHRKKFIAVSVSAVIALGACTATTSFMDKAKDFAMGTWACSLGDYPFSVGVKPDGTALFKADESTFVSQFKWGLDGGELNLEAVNLESGELAAASIINVADLEQGFISNEGSPKGVESLIKGEKGSISITKWDFDARTVSFEEKREGYRTDVASCKKASDTVTLKATTKADLDAAAASAQKDLRTWAISLEQQVRLEAAFSKYEPAVAVIDSWKKVLGNKSLLKEGVAIFFTNADGTLEYLLTANGVNDEAFKKGLPGQMQFDLGQTSVCMKLSKEYLEAEVSDGYCSR
jgi:hypothetical protein